MRITWLPAIPYERRYWPSTAGGHTPVREVIRVRLTKHDRRQVGRLDGAGDLVDVNGHVGSGTALFDPVPTPINDGARPCPAEANLGATSSQGQPPVPAP
jgi:hypothetical protein